MIVKYRTCSSMLVPLHTNTHRDTQTHSYCYSIDCGSSHHISGCVSSTKSLLFSHTYAKLIWMHTISMLFMLIEYFLFYSATAFDTQELLQVFIPPLPFIFYVFGEERKKQLTQTQRTHWTGTKTNWKDFFFSLLYAKIKWNWLLVICIYIIVIQKAIQEIKAEKNQKMIIWLELKLTPIASSAAAAILYVCREWITHTLYHHHLYSDDRVSYN